MNKIIFLLFLLVNCESYDPKLCPIGEKVKLISGGPIMTIVRAEDYYGYCRCIWFNNNGELQDNSIKFTFLEKVK